MGFFSAYNISATIAKEIETSKKFAHSSEYQDLFAALQEKIIDKLHEVDNDHDITFPHINGMYRNQYDIINRQIEARRPFFEDNPEYAKEINSVAESYAKMLNFINKAASETFNNTSDNTNASLISYSPSFKAKRSPTINGDVTETSSEQGSDKSPYDESNHLGADAVNTETNLTHQDAMNSSLEHNGFNMMLPLTLCTSWAIAATFTASNVKTMHQVKQGGSTIGTAVRTGVQIAVPSVVGSVAAVGGFLIGAVTGFVALGVAAIGAGVGLVCGGVTLGITLYYNKFFVAKKLRGIEDLVKKISTNDISLVQKKLLIGLIHYSRSLLNGERKDKSTKKIKKLDSKILFNLNEMKNILSSPEVGEQSKIKQTYRKKINQRIAEILEHSALFSLLMNDMKHIKEIYKRLNVIKKCEQGNKKIQDILAKIDLNNPHIASYDDLLERFIEEQEYITGNKGKLRTALQSIIFCISEKKEFVDLHEEIIDLALDINEDYRHLKKLIHSLQEYVDTLKLDTSKQQLLDIYTAFMGLSYRDALEKNTFSLMRNKEHVDHDFIPNEVMNFETMSQRGFVTA